MRAGTSSTGTAGRAIAAYLDRALDRPGPGFRHTADMVRRVLAALADEALSGGLGEAARLAAE